MDVELHVRATTRPVELGPVSTRHLGNSEGGPPEARTQERTGSWLCSRCSYWGSMNWHQLSSPVAVAAAETGGVSSPLLGMRPPCLDGQSAESLRPGPRCADDASDVPPHTAAGTEHLRWLATILVAIASKIHLIMYSTRTQTG